MANAGTTAAVVGITIVPDGQAYVLTISEKNELTGWLGTFGSAFAQGTISSTPIFTSSPAAAMTVRNINPSQVEVQIAALGRSSQSQVFTYLWSTYEAGSGFGKWNSNQLPLPTGNNALIPELSPAIAVRPNGKVDVIALAPIANQTLQNYPTLHYSAPSPGSNWTLTVNDPLSGPSYPAMLGNLDESLHVAAVAPFSGGAAPVLTDYVRVNDGASVDLIMNKTTNFPISSQLDRKYAPGIAVRSTGTLDAVFMNYGTEVSQLLYFTLAAGSANWNDYFIANYT